MMNVKVVIDDAELKSLTRDLDELSIHIKAAYECIRRLSGNAYLNIDTEYSADDAETSPAE